MSPQILVSLADRVPLRHYRAKVGGAHVGRTRERVRADGADDPNLGRTVTRAPTARDGINLRGETEQGQNREWCENHKNN